MDPFKAALKFLGVTESALWATQDLKRVQEKAESLLEHYTIEGKDADAKKVLKALFVIKQTLKEKKSSQEKKDDIFGDKNSKEKKDKREVPAKDAIIGPAKKPRVAERISNSIVGNSLSCPSCGKSYDADKFNINCPGSFLCPKCRFLEMDPFNAVVEGNRGILSLTFVEDSKFKFKVDLPKLQKWRKKEYNIEARMCCLDSCRVKQVWPKSLSFEINRQKSFEIKEPEPGHKRRDLPQNVSADLRPGENQIRVKLEDDHVTNFVLALVLTMPQTPECLSLHVARERKSTCQQRIRDLLSTNGSSTVGLNGEVQCLSSNRIRLHCPITFSQIQTPVRGWKCQHFQCFDLEGYLISNRRMKAVNNRWSCPVCNIVLKPPADLCIDTYFDDILESTRKHKDDDNCFVEFDAKGEWRLGFDEIAEQVSSPGTPPDELNAQHPKECNAKDHGDSKTVVAEILSD